MRKSEAIHRKHVGQFVQVLPATINHSEVILRQKIRVCLSKKLSFESRSGQELQRTWSCPRLYIMGYPFHQKSMGISDNHFISTWLHSISRQPLYSFTLGKANKSFENMPVSFFLFVILCRNSATSNHSELILGQ